MSHPKSTFIKNGILPLIAGMLIIAGCGGSSSPTSPNNGPTTPPPPSSGHFHSVAIQNFAFSPAALTVAVGDTVKWTNNDSAPHTVTSDSGSELQSPQLANGQTYQHIFGTAGSFAYHCAVHPSMLGSVTVQ